MGDVVFRCAGKITSPSISVAVYFNSNFTSRKLPDGTVEALLLTEQPGTRSDTLVAGVC
jgi:hypothetical protein